MRGRAIVLATIGALALSVVTACSGKGHEPKTHHVDIRGMKYVPEALEVNVGDTVVWTNSDVMPHTVTSTAPAPAAFDSKDLPAKQKWQYRVTAAGEHPYVCTYHPTMRGTITAR